MGHDAVLSERPRAALVVLALGRLLADARAKIAVTVRINEYGFTVNFFRWAPLRQVPAICLFRYDCSKSLKSALLDAAVVIEESAVSVSAVRSAVTSKPTPSVGKQDDRRRGSGAAE